MPVTVDARSLATEELGLQTVGEVLAHLRNQKRLVVQVRIDGKQPDAARLRYVRGRPVAGHHLEIETTDPSIMACQVLSALDEQLTLADQLKNQILELLSANQYSKATEKLTACLKIWQHSHEAVEKIAKLLSLDSTTIIVERQPLSAAMANIDQFVASIKLAVDTRAFENLNQLLNNDAHGLRDWQQNVRALSSLLCC